MKTSLKHLPLRNQRDIRRLKDLILKDGKGVEMIILYGSFARGTQVNDWHEEEGHRVHYISDYDMLVVTEKAKDAFDYSFWSDMEERWNRYLSDNKPIIEIIAHGIDYLNKQLERKQFFFSDIKREGIMLYDSGRFKLARRRKLNMAEIKEIAEENFEVWFENAKMFFENYESCFKKGNAQKNYLRIAAFELHQAAENAYHALSLVFTGDKPKCHNLRKLGKMVSKHSPKLKTIFPKDTQEHRDLFDLLVRAYIEARYSKYYRIEKAELEYLAPRVKALLDLVESLCKERIASLS